MTFYFNISLFTDMNKKVKFNLSWMQCMHLLWLFITCIKISVKTIGNEAYVPKWSRTMVATSIDDIY